MFLSRCQEGQESPREVERAPSVPLVSAAQTLFAKHFCTRGADTEVWNGYSSVLLQIDFKFS